MSKDRKPRYFDFIHQHEERLNLIYRRWEDQIAKQAAVNSHKSQTLVGKIKSHKKAAVAGMAIAFSSVLLACQYGKQINSSKNLIASNAQKIELMNMELQQAVYQGSTRCMVNGDIYQLTLGDLNHQALANEPRSFISQLNTISVVRHSFVTQQPDTYLRLNPDRSLLFGSIEQTDNAVQTDTQTIDLNRDLASLPLDREEMNNYREVQENAIALHEELFQCFAQNSVIDPTQPFFQFPYAD